MAVASARPYANLHLAQADNHASISPLSFLEARCSFCHPTNSIKAVYSAVSECFDDKCGNCPACSHAEARHLLYRQRRENRSYSNTVLLITCSRTAAKNMSTESDDVEAAEMIRPSLMDFCGSSDSAQNVHNTASIYRVGQKKPHTILLSISLLNIDRFS